jgi:hypothetical protein
MRIFAAILFLPLAALWAQTQTAPPPQTEPAPPPEPERAYVRRISLGLTVTVLGLSTVPGKQINTVTETPAIDGLYTTEAASRRFGYGATAQAALSERFALNVGVYLRRAGYKMRSDVISGTDNPNTDGDERTQTVINENTKARFMDIPVTIRYYGKDRHEPGARWFLEAGAALRRTFQVTTVTDTTVDDGDFVFDHTPTKPAHRWVKGAVVGAGFQVVDDVGIRVVPGVRYTRWLADPFNSFSTAVRRNQVEGLISITF